MPINYKKYPENWLSAIRPRIMKRAENKCEFCGLEHKSTVFSTPLRVQDSSGRYKSRSIWFRSEQDAIREANTPAMVKPVKVVITIAHLDHDEENHQVQDERLAALCQICHLRYDAQEKYRRMLKTINQ